MLRRPCHAHRSASVQGSDISARTATKSVLALGRQIEELDGVLVALGLRPDAATSSPKGSAAGLGKNTIVRGVLHEMQGRL